jgi:hypothetical protein
VLVTEVVEDFGPVKVDASVTEECMVDLLKMRSRPIEINFRKVNGDLRTIPAQIMSVSEEQDKVYIFDVEDCQVKSLKLSSILSLKLGPNTLMVC